VELELNQHADAIATFEESLKLQRKLLPVENPLIISTMDNLGFAYTMSRLYHKANEVSKKLDRRIITIVHNSQVGCIIE
jgi:Tetratricopeptide repeat